MVQWIRINERILNKLKQEWRRKGEVVRNWWVGVTNQLAAKLKVERWALDDMHTKFFFFQRGENEATFWGCTNQGQKVKAARVRVGTTHYLIIQDFGSMIDGVSTPLVEIALDGFYCDYSWRDDRGKSVSFMVRIWGNTKKKAASRRKKQKQRNNSPMIRLLPTKRESL